MLQTVWHDEVSEPPCKLPMTLSTRQQITQHLVVTKQQSSCSCVHLSTSLMLCALINLCNSVTCAAKRMRLLGNITILHTPSNGTLSNPIHNTAVHVHTCVYACHLHFIYQGDFQKYEFNVKGWKTNPNDNHTRRRSPNQFHLTQLLLSHGNSMQKISECMY